MLLWLSALAPIAVILILMLGLRQGGDRAGLAGWLTAVLLAAAAFGAGPRVLWVAQGKALLLAAYVLYIIWMALLFYHTLNEAGAVRAIGAGLASLTPNRDIQALLLSWAFGSFLQGVSGYGVPTAVVAPLMVAVGFDASAAVVAAGLGHAWAVTFGSLSASFQALIAASGRTGPELAPSAALLLSVACLACGLVVLWVSGGPRAVRQSWGFVLVIGLLMGAAQYLLAWAGLYSIAAIGAGLVGLGAASLLAHRWRPAAGPAQADGVQATTAPVYPAPAAIRPMPLRLALLPYGLLVVGIGLTEFVPAIGGVLDALTVRVGFPAAETARGYATPAEAGRTISLFGHPGALLLYATLVIAWIYARRGRYEPGAGARIRRGVLKGALLPSVGILSMVAMATTMEHAGMTRLLAEGLASVTGAAFPAITPFIGALGAFMTGSNTNSNVLFTALQQDTATLLGLSPAIILAAQTAGGGLGAAFAPAKVIVGCSTVGLAGHEGGVLRATLLYGLGILGFISGLTWLWTRL